jgi:hypothetical protein
MNTDVEVSADRQRMSADARPYRGSAMSSMYAPFCAESHGREAGGMSWNADSGSGGRDRDAAARARAEATGSAAQARPASPA